MKLYLDITANKIIISLFKIYLLVHIGIVYDNIYQYFMYHLYVIVNIRNLLISDKFRWERKKRIEGANKER